MNDWNNPTDWHNIYITDKTGQKFFNCNASPMSTMSEICNLTRHLDAIKRGDKAYANVKVDQASAMLMLDNEPYKALDDILDDDDALLAEIMG